MKMNLAPACYCSLIFLLAVNLSGVLSNRIIGGSVVLPESIPYQASLKYSRSGSHFCGGTLIHPEWVVSAGHCWRPSHLIKVVLNEHHLDTRDGSEQIFDVTAVIRHRDYNHWMLDNDIMLLKLSRPAIISTGVQPASLPDVDSPALAPPAQCTVSGWGVTWVYRPRLSPELRSVKVDLLPSCWWYYKFRATKNMVCAGSRTGGRDSCQGDSGGPLICNGKFEGIVSWGISCGLRSYPGVYTKVRNYLQWIRFVIHLMS